MLFQKQNQCRHVAQFKLSSTRTSTSPVHSVKLNNWHKRNTPTLISFSSWLLQGRIMQILVCLSSWQRLLSLVTRDEMAMPQEAEHSLHSVVWTMQLSLGLSVGGPRGNTCLTEEGKGWIWEAPERKQRKEGSWCQQELSKLERLFCSNIYGFCGL